MNSAFDIAFLLLLLLMRTNGGCGCDRYWKGQHIIHVAPKIIEDHLKVRPHLSILIVVNDVDVDVDGLICLHVMSCSLLFGLLVSSLRHVLGMNPMSCECLMQNKAVKMRITIF